MNGQPTLGSYPNGIHQETRAMARRGHHLAPPHSALKKISLCDLNAEEGAGGVYFKNACHRTCAKRLDYERCEEKSSWQIWCTAGKINPPRIPGNSQSRINPTVVFQPIKCLLEDFQPETSRTRKHVTSSHLHSQG